MTVNKQEKPSKAMAALTLAALGVVYGDIGTSPLYTLRECFSQTHGVAPTAANILGVLSLVVWSLFIVVSLKYVVFIMRADNKGEGGVLALLSLATHVEPSALKRWWIVCIGLFGASLFYADGIITPAISVLSAVEGIELAAPELRPYVIFIAVGILCGLFAYQKTGTARVGEIFGPIMCVWFASLGVLGLRFVIMYPDVLYAFNPLYAVQFVLANQWEAFVVLGSVVLTS